MKKWNVFIIAVLALVLSLVLTGSAGAAGEVGFYVDCTGAYGYGWVPAHGEHRWVVTYWDQVAFQNVSWEGIVYGGASGAPFDMVILWPNPPIPGSGPDTSYYWVWIDGVLVQEGHFDCEPPPPPGGACTPGYWRNLRQHGDEWVLAGYSPFEDDFDTVFGVDLFDPDVFLNDTVRMGGGGVKKLARHGTAALLNAAHPGVDYPLTVEEVIAAVQAGAGNMLGNINENWDCPLN